MTRKGQEKDKKAMQRSGLDRYMYDTTYDGASEFQEPVPYNLAGAILKQGFLFLFLSVQALRSRSSSVDESDGRRTSVTGRQNCEKFGRCRRPQGPLWPQRFLFRTCTRSSRLARTFMPE